MFSLAGPTARVVSLQGSFRWTWRQTWQTWQEDLQQLHTPMRSLEVLLGHRKTRSTGGAGSEICSQWAAGGPSSSCFSRRETYSWLKTGGRCPCCADYKILSKALVLGQRAVKASIIHPDQTHCVPARLIRDNIVLIQVFWLFLVNSGLDTGVMLIEQEKAFFFFFCSSIFYFFRKLMVC